MWKQVSWISLTQGYFVLIKLDKPTGQEYDNGGGGF